jgi:hypothetical protein
MSSKAFIIPTDSLTFMDQKNLRIKALAGGVQRSYVLGVQTWDKEDMPLPPSKQNVSTPDYDALVAFISGGGWPKNLDVREFQPILDAGTALDQWNTAALAAVGTEYSIFQAIAAPAIALRTKKLVVWYKVQVETVPLPVSRLVFRRNVAAGNLQAEFDLEQLATQLRVDGYFSEPVIWDNNTAYAINVMARQIAAAARVIPGNFVFEPAGTTNN